MLRFFRHIRQKLFLEGRASKYLGYALGEVVLIVVGILIALQINDWNENRKLEKARTAMIEAFKVDFTQNLKNLEESLEVAQSRRERMEAFLLAIFDESIELESEELRRMSITFFSPGTFTARLGTYRQATTSGFIQHLRDSELSELLHAFDTRNTGLQRLDEVKNQDFFVGGVSNLRRQLGSLLTLQKNQVQNQQAFKYSSQELMAMLQQNENYAVYENMFTIMESKRRNMMALKTHAQEILVALEALE